MTTEDDLTLVGRSSSHFTRTARIFALELGVPHAFRPVLDMTTLDSATYADNPALKVPILIDAEGPLFGTENICRELVRRSGVGERVVHRGAVPERIVANAEELVLHAMTTEVNLVMTSLMSPNTPAPPKLRASLENALAFVESNLDRVLAALPAARVLSFFETSLFCLVTHLPFRRIMDDVDRYARLQAFCLAFGRREAARATEYRFDAV